jgi:hypothetical protein
MVAAMRKMSLPPGVGSESLKAEREKAIGEYKKTYRPPFQEHSLFVPLTLKASMLEAGKRATIK